MTAIVNPVVKKFNTDFSCAKASAGLCSKLSSNKDRHESLCVDCVQFNIIPKLTKAFLEALSKEITNIHIENMKWVEFESKYDNEQTIMKELKGFSTELKNKFA
jgi:hypothetical protein